ncbi:MAG: Rieske (2Fe-2S) protein [Candidatus Promineifilaceae bacterium]
MTKEHIVASVDQLAEGEKLIVEVNGREIGIFNVKGEYYALLNYCFHQGGPLCKGAVTGRVIADAESNWQRRWVQDGEILRCPWHFMEFDIKTGKSIIYPERGVRTYTVEVRADKLVLIV